MSTATYICIQVPVPVWCMNGWRGLAMSQKDEGRRTSGVGVQGGGLASKLDSVSSGGGDGALSNDSSVPTPPWCPHPYP
ncbi:GM15201 [Drosophila sechellia]|uniref:GM15201 n=1 Tax=Drosophila sechellia TaxID=7238 RepID=B4IBN0_DROSE|nr:GM15201 [Drosophila sechellia]